MHLLGFDHCIYYACVMNGSGHLAEDFSQPMHLCPVDLRKLQTLTGFDVLTRYRDLMKLYSEMNVPEEVEWTKKRLGFLTAKLAGDAALMRQGVVDLTAAGAASDDEKQDAQPKRRKVKGRQ
eukprot:TRINITY_DN12872_c0_g1_i1.p3 TRINITY_DN12872_c0_g1~~TRINITY_DN12872_c0_g1_i1.p3  ORF type:complete len:122 (+),score=33.82 TRINITY_DN12872_c0_g1_i1:808-1173(+)